MKWQTWICRFPEGNTNEVIRFVTRSACLSGRGKFSKHKVPGQSRRNRPGKSPAGKCESRGKQSPIHDGFPETDAAAFQIRGQRKAQIARFCQKSGKRSHCKGNKLARKSCPSSKRPHSFGHPFSLFPAKCFAILAAIPYPSFTLLAYYQSIKTTNSCISNLMNFPFILIS